MTESLRALLVGATGPGDPLAAELRAELRRRDVVVGDGEGPAAVGRGGPTHLFVLRGEGDALAELLAAARALSPLPRLVLLSRLRPGSAARAAEDAVRASGLPYTIARPGRLAFAGGGAVARPVLRAVWAAAGAIGLARFAARHRPIDARELAYGLVHAALNYTTIDRVVLAEELRWELANDRPIHAPRSRRDELRH